MIINNNNKDYIASKLCEKNAHFNYWFDKTHLQSVTTHMNNLKNINVAQLAYTLIVLNNIYIFII